MQERVFPWMSVIALPLTVAIVGHFVTRSIESARLDAEYVKLAVSVLTSPASPSEKEDKDRLALRQWAVQILNSRAPVSLGPSEAAGLAAFPSIRMLSRVDPPPKSFTEDCPSPGTLKEGASAVDLAKWTSEWIGAYGCEKSKRSGLIEAWPR